MDKTLVIMAAGMGSRYGGNKQMDGMGPGGETLLEYSVYDALKAGFNKVVFIIKRDFEKEFRDHVGRRVEKAVSVEYAFQGFDTLPEWYHMPPERKKPFGTVHAVLCASDMINEPFAVINADDYYGKPAYALVLKRIGTLAPEREACMAGYYLKNTVSENGHVTRGVCKVNEKGRLVSVTETYQIKPFPDGTIRDTEKDPEGVILDPESLVSMNFFGFTPWFLQKAREYFDAFLKSLTSEDVKKEFVLPMLVDKLMKNEGLLMDVLPTDASWFGVTYREDKPYVQATLRRMHENGDYPERMF